MLTVRLMASALAMSSLFAACGGAAPATSASAPTVNPIVAYLRGAELQCEEPQVANIHRALEDLATLPVTALRARRYLDYTGTPDAWDLPSVLRSHFVPDDRSKAGIVDDPDAFWAAADSDEVRTLAQEMLRALDEPSRASPVLAP